MYSYLLGSWTLKRTMEYEVGGMTGTFEGTAMFEPFFFDYFVPRDILTYVESGTFHPTEPSMPDLPISNQMLYEFTGAGVKVFFDGLRGERGSDAVMAHAKYLYTIKPATLELEDYSDDPKLYGKVRAKPRRMRCGYRFSCLGRLCSKLLSLTPLTSHRIPTAATWRFRHLVLSFSRGP